MNRKIYAKLLEWKNNKEHKPLMILGARQVGKTYIIQKFCEQEYEDYVFVNLFNDVRVIDLYKNSNKSSEEKFQDLKLYLNKDLDNEKIILFIDEIQESESLISELKFLCENHPKVNIICAGSLLGVKLKRGKFSFPVGKVTMLTMYPMDFEEFLDAQNENMLIEKIKDCYNTNSQMPEILHEKLIRYYRLYLISGGMPEAVKNMIDVNNDVIKFDKKILTDIKDSYFNDMKKYVTSESESLKITNTYNSIPNQLGNLSNKFQYSKLTKNGKKREYESSLSWLLASNMVLVSNMVSTPQKPLKGYIKEDYFKLYLSDVGILNNLLEVNFSDIMNDELSLYKGIIAENYVAESLFANDISLFYWQSDRSAEIDFLIYNDDGIIPIEVKSSNNTQSKSLNIYKEKFNPPYLIRISSKNFGYVNNIKSVPLYAVFCIK